MTILFRPLGAALRTRGGRYGSLVLACFLIFYIVNFLFISPPQRLMSNFGIRPHSGIAGAYLAARHAERENNPSRTSAYYERVLAVRPDDTRLQYGAFNAYLANGDIDSAIALAPGLATQQAEDYMPHLVLYIAHIREGDWKAARDNLDNMPQGVLRAFFMPSLTGWLALADGQIDVVKDARDKIRERLSNQPIAMLQAGLLGALAGNIESSLHDFALGWKNGGARHVYYALTYGTVLEHANNVNQAIRVYTFYQQQNVPHPVIAAALVRARSKIPPSPLTHDPQLGIAGGLYLLAEQLAQTKRFTPALQYAQLALTLDTGLEFAQFLRADILAIQQQWTLAESTYRAIDSGTPLGLSAEIRAAIMRARSGDVDAAIVFLKKIVTNLHAPSALIALGDIYSDNGRYLEAESIYSRAIKAISQPAPVDAHIYFMRGVARDKLGNWDAAERDLKRAARLSRNAPYMLNYLGYSWAQRGVRLNEALRLIDRAVRAEPKNGAFLDSLGWVYFRLGNLSRALTFIEQASQFNPSDAEIVDHLGDILWHVGRKVEARYQWQKAIQLELTADQRRVLTRKLATGRPLFVLPLRVPKKSVRPRRSSPESEGTLEI